MAVAEQQLSPEEKLLKVIQGGGEPEKQPSPEEKLLATAKPLASQGAGVRGQRSAPPASAAPPAVPRPPKIAPVAAVPSAPLVAKAPPAPAAVQKPAAAAAKPTPPVAAQKPVAVAAQESGGRNQGAGDKRPATNNSATQPPNNKGPKAVESKPPTPAKSAEPKKPAEAKPAAPLADEKAKLKVVKPEPAPQEKEASAKTMLGAPGPIGIGGPLDISVKGRSGRKFTMGALNRGLAAAVLLILAFTAYEIWAAVKKAEVKDQRSEVSGQKSEGSVGETGSPAELPALATYVDPWKEKDIFTQTSVKSGGDQGTPSVTPPAALAALAGQVKAIGFSKHPDKDVKAILRDTKDDKMFIIGAGEKILVEGQPLELVQIQSDHVVLSDGKDSVSVPVK